MNTASIEVKFADPPKDGKKQATVRTTDGTIYGIWPDKLGLLRPGQSYDVEFSERQYNGKTYRTIAKVKPREGIEGAPSLSTLSPSTKAESEFVTHVIAAAVASQQIEFGPAELSRAMRMVQAVYREFERQSGSVPQ